MDSDIAQRVARALPATYMDPEAYDDYPTYSDERLQSISQYISYDNVSFSCRSVRDSENWSEIKDDPAFRSIDGQSEMIPFDELGAYQAHRDEDQRLNDERADDDYDTSDNDESEHASRLGHDSRDGSHQTEVVPGKEDTEDVLARLGVTGEPKPVEKEASVPRPIVTNRESSPPSERRSARRSQSPIAKEPSLAGPPSSETAQGSLRGGFEMHESMPSRNGMPCSDAQRRSGFNPRQHDSRSGPMHGKKFEGRPPPQGQTPFPRRDGYRKGSATSHDQRFNAQHHHRHDGRTKPHSNENKNENHPDNHTKSKQVSASTESHRRNGRTELDHGAAEQRSFASERDFLKRKASPLRQADEVAPKRKATQSKVASAFR